MGRPPQRLPQRQQQADGVPPSPSKMAIFDSLPHMNTKPARQNLPEKEAAWIENLQPVGGNDLRVVPAPLFPSLAMLPGKIVTRMFSAAILSDPAQPAGPMTDYVIYFATDGSATAVNAADGTMTEFAPPGTYSLTPDMTVYSGQRLLIVDNTAAGYSTWDGHAFVSSGGVSPNIVVTNGGNGYFAPPDVAIIGGSGFGATAHAVMGGNPPNQFVAQIVLDSPGQGYVAGDTFGVSITGGGGSGATANALLWPQLQGNTIAVFGGRVWIAKRRVLTYTGTAGYDDTDPANAAGSFTITDEDLVHEITVLRGLNNYLYIFGDQSIKQIGSITVTQPAAGSGQSATTQFQILTLASDIGCPYAMSVLSYNRIAVFANKHGIYGIFGASVQKLSDDLDGLFTRIDWSQEPSAALNDLNNLHSYLLLVRYQDPDNVPVFGPLTQGAVHLRSLICVLQTKDWYVVAQGDGLMAITSVPMQATLQVETMGSSGSDVTELLIDTETPVTWILKTALTAKGNIITAKQLIKAGVALSSGEPQMMNMLAETENKSNNYPLPAVGVIRWTNRQRDFIQFTNTAGGVIVFTAAPAFKLPYRSVDGYGRVFGATLWSNSKNMAVNAIMMEYMEVDPWGEMP